MNIFRNPEGYRYRSPSTKALFENKGLVDILPPFESWRIFYPVDWSKPLFEDKTWQLYFYSLGWTNLFVSSNHEKSLEDAKDLVLSISSFLEGKVDDDLEMYWFDHATALRASHVSHLYTLFLDESILNESEEKSIENFLKTHLNKLCNYILSSRWERNNHTIFHAEAIIDILNCSRTLTRNQKSLYRTLARESLEILFEDIFDQREGVCVEQSLFYHQFDADLLHESAKFMRLNDIDVSYSTTELKQKIYDFIWLVAPYGTGIPAIGDTAFNSSIDEKRLSSIFEEVGRSYIEEYISSNGTSQKRPEPITYFENTGYVVFFLEAFGESEEISVNSATFIEKKKKEPHGHFDGNSFTISNEGYPIVVDSGGPYKYGNPLHYKYFMTQLAHNTLILDATPQNLLTEVVCVKSSQHIHGVMSKCKHEEFNWKRIFLSVGANTFLCLDVFHDNGGSKREIDILLHLNGDMKEVSSEKEEVSFISGNEKNVKIHNFSDLDFSNHFQASSSPQDPIFPSYRTSAIGVAEPTAMQRLSTREYSGWICTVIKVDADGSEPRFSISDDASEDLVFGFIDGMQNFSLKVFEDGFDIFKVSTGTL